MSNRMTPSERQFVEFLESQFKHWIYEPCGLDTSIPCDKLERNKLYIPDFWCPEDDCFYEVSSGKHVYLRSMKKIPYVISTNPGIKIVVVNPDGSLFYEEWSKDHKIKEYSHSQIFNLPLDFNNQFKLFSVLEVARYLRIEVKDLKILAAKRGVGRKIGKWGMWVFTKGDIEKLKIRKDGRPKKT